MPRCGSKPRKQTEARPTFWPKLFSTNDGKGREAVAIAELQIRQTAFSLMIQHLASNQRLPSATLKIPNFSVLDDMPLDGIACVGCTFAGFDLDGMFADLELQFRFYSGLAAVRSAGSLQQPPTQTANHILRLQFSIAVNSSGVPALTIKDPLGLKGLESLASNRIDLSSLAPFPVVASSILLSDDDSIVAIRLASDPSDPVRAPAVNRLPEGSDWAQFVPGSAIADVIRTSLGNAVASVVDGNSKYGVGKAASAAYITVPLPTIPAAPPFIWGSAQVKAIDACFIFNIDVAVDLRVIATFVTNGPSIETTLVLSWSADSTWCQVADFFVATPFITFFIAQRASDKASQSILGSGVDPSGFHEISRGDDSITYRQQKILPVPPPLKITASNFDNDGLVVSGIMQYPPPGLGLQGWVEPATSGLSVSCSSRRVTVKFNSPQVGLVDHNLPGDPPRIFPETLVVPADAWVVIPGTGNDTLETLITFADPPSGRLPAGTATSVFISTDCGMRWVDLGVIPPDHSAPTTADTAAMISSCMAKSAAWKERVLSVKWLPRPEGDTRTNPAIRQWLVGMVGMAERTQLQFVAIGRGGAERIIGTSEKRKDLAAEIVTAADETLEIRSNQDQNPAPTIMSQRWISPLASMRLRETPVAMAAVAGLMGLRHRDKSISIIRIGTRGELHQENIASLSGLPFGGDALAAELDRAQQRGKQPWHTAVQLDSRIIGVMHGEHLLIGSAGELHNALTSD
jgi:hypothetical protein